MSESKYQIIGIDLGTTNSVMARKGVSDAQVIRNAEGEVMTRSIVSNFKGKILVGRQAENRWELIPEDTIVSIKRLMGRSQGDKEVKDIAAKGNYHFKIVEPKNGTSEGIAVVMGDDEYAPEDVSALILKKLKDDASNKLGTEVTHAVITVPAYFTDKQRYATKEAGIKAGLSVMGLIDEPTAAALAYGFDEDFEDAKGILVFDLGGGTFDVSVLMMASGTYTLMGKEGDMWLGGDDFDNVIYEYAEQEITKEYGKTPFEDKKFVTMLKKECTKAKETLSSSDAASIFLTSAFKDEDGDPVDIDIEITRDEFEKRAAHLVERAVKVVYNALEITMLDKDEDINYVILAGNSSRMPMIQEAVEKIFGPEKVKKDMPFKESVAMGAAMYASRLAGVMCPKCDAINDMDAQKCEKCGEILNISKEKEEGIVLQGDITAHSYGIQTEGDKYNIFIDKGDPIPTPKEDRKPQTFTTQNPKYINIPVYGGEEMNAASENSLQLMVFARVPNGYPAGTVVNIRLWLNRDNYFEVEGWLADGTRLNFIVVRGGISDKVVQEYLKLEERWDNCRNNVLKNDFGQGQEIESKIDKIGQDMGGEKINSENVLKDIEDINKTIDEKMPTGAANDKVLADVIIGLINKFEWAVSKADKEEAVKKADEYKKDIINKNEFNTWFEEFMKKNMVLSVLATASINLTQLQSIDKQKYNSCSNKFDDIIERLKKGDQNAANDLIALMNEIKEVTGASGTVTCGKCGAQNSSSAIKCEKCGYPLGLLS